MLNIMSLAYQGASGSELARQKGYSREERRKQIFRLYVEQTFQRKGTPSHPFPKEKIIGWLSWLAGEMKENSQSVFFVEGLQPNWLGKRAERAAYGSVAALGLGLIFALSCALIFGLIFWLGLWLFANPMLGGVGLIGGAICGSLIFLGVALGCWSESPLKNGLVSGSIVGLLLAGPIIGLSAVWNLAYRRELLGLALPIGVSVGLIGGAISGLGIRSLNDITLVE